MATCGARMGGALNLQHIFNISLFPATALCTFKLAYIFYNQNLHEEASSISELFCRMLETTDSYKYPEIPHERVSGVLPFSAQRGAEGFELWPSAGGVKERLGTGWLPPGGGARQAAWALKPLLRTLPAAPQMLQAAGGELPKAGPAGERPGLHRAVAGGAAGPPRGAAGRARLPVGPSENRRREAWS